MSQNPFPGPQPYRAADRARFFGRDDVTARLVSAVLTQRAVVLFGPSGAGKSSLMQAAVIPLLEEAHGFRVVRVDTWPEDQPALAWLADALFAELKLGKRPEALPPEEAVPAAIQRAMRRSDRPVLIYLDQIEQLFYASRAPAEADALLGAVDALADRPLRGLQIVLSLREDYLGRLRDRVRARPRLLANGFRVGLLTVAEVAQAMVQAARSGAPPQTWSPAELGPLMIEVRTPGQFASEEAEAQTAYAQIVCRALWAERDQDGSPRSRRGPIAAEEIIRRYFEAVLNDLGPLREAALELLENQLVTLDGSRTLRTEKELGRAVPAEALGPVLRGLEAGAILRAEEHQGSRYFEIGHDWLARRVFDGKKERERRRQREEEEKRREEARQAELGRQRAEAEARLKKEQESRTFFKRLMITGFVVAATAAIACAWSYHLKGRADALLETTKIAQQHAEEERAKAEASRKVAAHASLVAGVSQLMAQERLGRAAKLLLEMPEAGRSSHAWQEMALRTLAQMKVQSTLYGHQRAVLYAAFTAGGEGVISASADGEIRAWQADGHGRPPEAGDRAVPVIAAVTPFGGDGIAVPHKGSVVLRRPGGETIVDTRGEDAVFAVASPDGSRVVTIARTGVARLWSASGGAAPIDLEQGSQALSASFSPDGQRFAVASEARAALVYSTGGKLTRALPHDGPVGSAVFTPDGKLLVTASADAKVRVWRADAAGKPLRVFSHRSEVWRGWPGLALLDASGKRIVSGSIDGTVRVFSIDGEREPIVLRGHSSVLLDAAFDRRGRRLVTASEDNSARIWDLEGSLQPIILRSHRGRVESVGWSPDDRRVVTASADTTVKIWVADGSGGVTFRGHTDRLSAGGWLPGDRVLTASDDCSVRFWQLSPREGPREIEDERRDVGSAVTALGVSPDGASFVTAGYDGAVKLWRVADRGRPVVLATRSAPVNAVVFSHDGARIAAASDDGTVTVWGVADHALLASIALPAGSGAWDAVWSPSDDRLAVVVSDGALRVYPSTGGSPLSSVGGERAAAAAVAFGPDGKWLAVASTDGLVRLWDITGKPGPGDGDPPRVLEGHGDRVQAVSFSSDGKTLLTGSDDNTARLWDLTGSAMIPHVLQGHEGNVRGAFFDPAGKRILTVSDDQTARIWELDVGVIARRLHDATTECLLPEMRVDFLDETAGDAEQRFAACEREYGRREFKPGDDVE